MKEEYIKPTISCRVIVNECHLVASSSSEEDSETCDCFAHKGKHNKCGEGCHNSGPKESFDFSSSIF